MTELLVTHGDALLFYLFAALAVGGAIGVVALRNPMYGAIALLSSFLSVAALFLLRHAELVALVQVFVYGGGIMVLFLFVIMLVNLHRLREVRLFAGTAPLAWVLAIVLLGLFGLWFLRAPVVDGRPPEAGFVEVGGVALGNSQAVAWELFRGALLPFEIASLFLLVAMIGAVVLGRKE